MFLLHMQRKNSPAGTRLPISVVHSDKADMNIFDLWHGPTCAFKIWHYITVAASFIDLTL